MSDPNATNPGLLESLKTTRDGDAWKTFKATYDEIIERWLRIVGLQAEDVDDIRQDVVATVLQEIGGFVHDGRPGTFRRWLRSIMVQRLRKMWQHRQNESLVLSRSRLSDLADELTDDNSQLSHLLEHEYDRYVAEKLFRAVEAMVSPRDLEIFREIVLGEIPAEKVADRYGMTVGAVRVAQHRVLVKMRRVSQQIVLD